MNECKPLPLDPLPPPPPPPPPLNQNLSSAAAAWRVSGATGETPSAVSGATASAADGDLGCMAPEDPTARGLHSSNSRLNVSAVCGTGVEFMVPLRVFKGC